MPLIALVCSFGRNEEDGPWDRKGESVTNRNIVSTNMNKTINIKVIFTKPVNTAVQSLYREHLNT